MYKADTYNGITGMISLTNASAKLISQALFPSKYSSAISLPSAQRKGVAVTPNTFESG